MAIIEEKNKGHSFPSSPFIRSVDTDTYLKYLFQSLTMNDLKQLCRHHQIKGYSSLKKQQLIQFLISNLSEEEKEIFLEENEEDLIKKEIEKAFRVLLGKSTEKITTNLVINKELGEFEITFTDSRKGTQFFTTAFLSLENGLADPMRDCDCIIGANGGLCHHIWILLFQASDKGYFSFNDWTLSMIPSGIRELLTKIKNE